MAQAMIKDSNLRLIFETGMDTNGEPIFKAKAYNNIKKEASVDQVYQVALAIANLSSYSLSAIERNDSFDVIA